MLASEIVHGRVVARRALDALNYGRRVTMLLSDERKQMAVLDVFLQPHWCIVLDQDETERRILYRDLDDALTIHEVG